MQVKHEGQLIEPTPLIAQEFQLPNGTQTLDTYTLRNQSLLSPIELVACSPANGGLIAVYLFSANQIQLIEGKSRSKRARFALKSCDAKKFSRLSFTAKGLDFSPDGTRLAVGQTDCIIYIYKIGLAGELDANWKPTITGKFVCSSPVTCLLWTEFGIVFGTQDGKIKLISMQASKPTMSAADAAQPVGSTKVISVYSSAKATAPLLLATRASQLAVGFMDGSVLLVALPVEPASEQSESVPSSRRASSIVQVNATVQTSFPLKQPCPPIYLAILSNNTLCCAQCDGRLSLSALVESPGGGGPTATQELDLRDSLVALDYSTANELLVAATPTRLLFVRYEQEANRWQLEPSSIQLAGQNSLTGVKWSKDGGQLVLGTGAGSLELFGCQWSKQSVGEQLDICHIAKNRVRLSDRARNLLATYKTQHDIKRVNVLDGGQSVVIWTSSSLLLARLASPMLQSELPRDKSGATKVTFEHPGFVLLYRGAGQELQVVKLGHDRVLHRVRLASLHKSCLSVRQFPLPRSVRAAYLADWLSSPSRQRSAGVVRLAPTEPMDRSPTRLQPADEIQRFAYAIDNQLHVIELTSDSRELELVHSDAIRWLSLSYSCQWLAFRDSVRRMHVLAPSGAQKSNRFLLSECRFSGWLPDSDILVAQSGWQICVWFSMEEPNRVHKLDARTFNITQAPPVVDLSGCSLSYPRVSRVNSDSITLSNGSLVSLDPLKVKFYAELAGSSPQSLEGALDLLERASERPLGLWTKLGWLAIERADCRVAIRVFSRLKYASLLDYLEKSALADSQDECRRRLAKLRGDWRTFEQLSEPDEILNTYRRLSKWSLALDYLARTQQFRQRDLLEQEQRLWLIGRSRFLDAARIQARAGDLEGAAELLLTQRQLVQAAQLLLAEEKSPVARNLSPKLRQLVEQLKTELVNEGRAAEAGKLCDRLLAKPQEAIQLYLKAELFREALDLAQQVNLNADERHQIEAKLGENLLARYRAHRLSRRAALASLDYLLSAGRVSLALSAALELRDLGRAFEIVKVAGMELPAEELADLSSKVADQLLAAGDRRPAIEALLAGRHYERVVSLHLESGDPEAAHAVALEHLHAGDRAKASEAFCEIARRLVEEVTPSEEQTIAAERIYLMLGRPELAIGLHRRLGAHERMLDLIELHQPELAEDTLLQLAREAEAHGQLEMAERYLLRAAPDDWPGVVRMYRLNGRWDEAFRVASDHCASERDPLLVQLAFWWAKSLATGGQLGEARRLLSERLHLFGQVVEFCCENKSFQFALELCRAGEREPALESRLVRRYARHLADQQRLAQAEELLVEHGQAQAAVQMYLDSGRPTEAIRVAESQPDELLRTTLVECARQLEAEGPAELPAAQQMYLRAQRPELAVEMYRRRQMWPEAMRVAQRFAPQLLEGVEAALDEQFSRDLRPILDEASAQKQQQQQKRQVSRPAESLARVSADELQAEAERRMRDGDQRGTKAALAEFLSSLEPSSRPGELSGQLKLALGQLEGWLQTAGRGRAEPQRALALVERALACSRWPADEEDAEWRAWQRLRDLQLACLDGCEMGAEPSPAAYWRLHEHLVLSHLLVLHRFLSGQLGGGRRTTLAQCERMPSREPAAELLGELSWRLLEWPLLEPVGAHYHAARWLLATKRPELARAALSRLLELAPDGQADARLEEARQWLLQDLIGSGGGRPATREATVSGDRCLACGGALTGGRARVPLGQRSAGGRVAHYEAHADEWRLLESLGADADGLPVAFGLRLGER